MKYHESILVHEVVKGLQVRLEGKYIDATIGDGGHTKQIVGHGGVVLGIDQDPEAVNRAKKRLEREMEKGKVTMMNVNFDHIGVVARENGFAQADGILFDLGMSSFQLSSERGFSFQSDEPLDMRMDPSLAVTAADLVNALGKKELTELLLAYGHEPRAAAIASAVAAVRRQSPIRTAGQLSRIIEKVSPRQGKLHPATKTFMSLRVAVNDELGSLDRALPQAVGLLADGGRIAVISFHEGEDRIVKRFFRNTEGVAELPQSPIAPSQEEVRSNPRSRSARLRVAEKRRGQ